MTSRTSSILTIAGVTALGLVAYAVYFDYKRRNDADFRRKLRKEKKRVDKTVASQTTAASTTDEAELRAALEQLKKEEVPVAPEQKETYFMSQVATGEQLSIQGPAFYLPAALAFYRALRVYPSPVELMVIYQKTVPEPIFKLVIELTNLDVKDRVEGYYDHFPPKSLGVAVESRKFTTTVDGKETEVLKKVLVVKKDVKAGEVIYKENPVVSALDYDVQLAGTHCTHCMRFIPPSSPESPSSSTPIKLSDDPLNTVFCSKECEKASRSRSHNLLFTLERPLPASIPTEPVTPQMLEERKKAQVEYTKFIMGEEKVAPVLVARFIARQISAEMGKILTGATPTTPTEKETEKDFTDSDGGDYLLADHLERLRYLEINSEDPEEKDKLQKEMDLITEVLKSVLPGLEQFVTEERYKVLLGKMKYNSFGVAYDGGRNEKPALTVRPEAQEKTRTPFGTARQIGTAIYTVSSYLQHSCSPSARPEFSEGTNEIHLVATKDLKAGDELHVSWVDVSQHEDETQVEARRRRRQELARGWRFACTCDKCIEEAKELNLTTPSGEGKDESKVEDTVTRYEKNEGASI